MIEPGQLLDIFNATDDGFLVATVETVNEPDGDIYSFDIKRVQYRGMPIGLAGIKFFNIADEIDLTNYVRKTGDTMSGNLEFKRLKGGTYTTIKSNRPVGWDSDGKKQFGLIFDIADGNTYKHSFQIKARVNTTMYKCYYDNTEGAVSTFGRADQSPHIKVTGSVY